LAHSSVCQGSHTLAHPSDLRLGKGCKTLLSLSLSGFCSNPGFSGFVVVVNDIHRSNHIPRFDCRTAIYIA